MQIEQFGLFDGAVRRFNTFQQYLELPVVAEIVPVSHHYAGG